MRTLSRPMFNMGGPIKQGIMNGIREPHQAGLAVGIGSKIMPHIRKAGQVFKNIFGKSTPAQGELYKTPFKPATWKARPFIERDPIYKGGKWGYETLTGPTAKTWGKKALQAVGTPTGVAALTWTGYQWLKPDGTPANKDEIELNKYKHGPFDHTPKKTKEAAAAFAKSQREDRVNKYLDMMGYDRSKKLAIADALIDASKIVGERGTLEAKNITQELISPIIQATSKRLDKPEQIREAVGLMSVKAAIEKDLEDPQVKALRALQIEKGELDLERGFETDIRNLLLSRKDKVNKSTLERYARLTADKYGEPFTVVDETTVIGKEPGIYMVEDKIFRVDENGQAKQIA